MANKATPKLPASSRMQMPSSGGQGTNMLIRETGGMKGSTGTTKRIMNSAKKGGMPSKKGC